MSNKAIAVYCGSKVGNQPAFVHAAESLGKAMARSQRPLVYGGGQKGIMGAVSKAVAENGGKVTGIVPFAMVAGGGEGSKSDPTTLVVIPNGSGKNDQVETIIVESMHERKVEMARRVGGFVALPGGYGTFEEVLEVSTWTQIGIHRKPVILLNVRSFYDPLRQLIKDGVREGFIDPVNEHIVIFVDGPPSIEEHGSFDWGKAALEAIDSWHIEALKPMFDWTKRHEERDDDKLKAT
ncbi:hypothetical protein ARMSODRAFT_954959 [Armillaria solidipes]|uniref:Lysine decarboxylase n=1 Tax=Armillaria solidipes TaxID=1076256 RepID=A0A2H3C308_9AGAR|nr:hypothetical protein ARMSODRAFT_954959 [Armillaria solidipes]